MILLIQIKRGQFYYPFLVSMLCISVLMFAMKQIQLKNPDAFGSFHYCRHLIPALAEHDRNIIGNRRSDLNELPVLIMLLNNFF